MKKNKGITLIALVITIIVLLILAGISISMLTGQNGILNRAQEAKEKTEEARKKELESLNNIDKIMYGAPIPENFYYVGGTIETGVVISDNKDDENKGVDYQSTMTLKGNQFVWVPVQTPICNEIIYMDNYSNKEDAINEIINKINADSNRKGYPMSIKIVDGKNVEYVSVLYNIELIENSEDNTYSISFTALPYSKENGNFREPDVASTADAIPKYLEILNFDSINSFEKELHSQYNQMVESVNKYGGFYVARYETTTPDENREEDELDNICCFKQERDVIINKNWYEFYKMHKDYGTHIGSNIQSNSIWGCQWDQIMIFMKDIKNEFDNNKPYIISGIGMATDPNGHIAKSASNEKYSVKNIFDIAGNVYEYTLETRSATTHTKRSSCYQNGVSVSAYVRNYVILQNETNTGGIYDGGRCSFYIQ